MQMRDYEAIQRQEEQVETALDTLHYEDLEHDKLQDLYVDLESRESLYHEWRGDDSVDWVVVDRHLEETAELAENLYQAAGYGELEP